jgi:hypothetical protein
MLHHAQAAEYFAEDEGNMMTVKKRRRSSAFHSLQNVALELCFMLAPPFPGGLLRNAGLDLLRCAQPAPGFLQTINTKLRCFCNDTSVFITSIACPAMDTSIMPQLTDLLQHLCTECRLQRALQRNLSPTCDV